MKERDAALRLRIMTYNVHRCVGYDGVHAPSRIARVIARHEPDLVALQELDVGRARTGGHDQPSLIAEQLGMRHFFFPALRAADEHYGDALLSRHPMQLVKAGSLPGLPAKPHLERRGALWAVVQIGGKSVQFFNTHLGLDRAERLLQVEALLGPEWLSHPACQPPSVVCGDFNAWPGTAVYRRLSSLLLDAQRHRLTPGKTFPARWPVLRIDHIFHSSDMHAVKARVPRTRLTGLVSDHLPVVADLELP